MSKNITLSKEHGVNPSIICCPICGNEVAIALMGKLKNDAKAPIYITGTEICDECKTKFDNGKIIVFEVITKNGVPEKTGRYIFVDRAAILIEINSKVAYMEKEDFIETFENNE